MLNKQQRASELLLLGTPVSASEAFSKFGFLNSVLEVPDSISPEEGNSLIEQYAINEYALKILKNSPDSVGVTKESLLRAKDGGDRDGWGIDQSAFQTYWSESSRALYAGSNIAEGLNAFKEVSEEMLSRRKVEEVVFFSEIFTDSFVLFLSDLFSPTLPWIGSEFDLC